MPPDFKVISIHRNFYLSCNFLLQPERIKPDQDNPGYNVKSDVWSLGITLVTVTILSALQTLVKVLCWQTTIATILQLLYRSACVSQHPQLRTAGFCWSWSFTACPCWWRRGIVVASMVSVNEVNLHWAHLVLGWVTVSGFDSRRRHFILVCNQLPRSTQPSILRGTVKWVPAKGRWCSAAGK